MCTGCLPDYAGSGVPPNYIAFTKLAHFGLHVIDILEPHDPTRIDNFGKAKGFAEYARQNPGVGCIQLIHMGIDGTGRSRLKRLDMSRSAIRDNVVQP